MDRQLYDIIDKAVASGMPPIQAANELQRRGWPVHLIKQALEQWMSDHGRRLQVTGFKEWIQKYKFRAKKAVAVVVVLNVIGAGIALLAPWPVKIMADSSFGNVPAPLFLEKYTGEPTLILITSLMSVSLFVVGAGFSMFRDYFLLKISFWLNRGIKEETFRHILHLPLFHKERLSKGDYVYRQNNVTESLADLVLGTTSAIIESFIMIFGILIIMTTFNLTLTLVCIFIIPMLFGTMRLVGPKIGKIAQQLNENNSETASRINEAIDNAETVQSFTLEDRMVRVINKLWFKNFDLSRANLIWGDLLNNMNGFIIVSASATIMYFGGSAAMEGKMTLGELLIFMTYMGYLLSPVQTLVREWAARNRKVIDVKRIYEVLVDHEGIENLRRNAVINWQIQGEIKFENVNYSYDGTAILRNLNLTIPPKQKVAIIGPSGGGKSTILKLLPLFIEPQAGRILIDGHDSQSVSLNSLRNTIGWVSQAPQLFSDTIAENILYGDLTNQVGPDQLKNAVVTANVAEFIVKLPLGLLSPAGENGSSLSGGQKQRIAIARALVKNSPILCMDEPTAALDAKSENYIRDSLTQIIQDKTVLMVTHRRSLLALMDVVYVLENGILRNVNELGGLDSYLAQLEGIEQRIAQEEISREAPVSGVELDDDFSSASGAIQELIAAEAAAIAAEKTEDANRTVNNNDEVIINLH